MLTFSSKKYEIFTRNAYLLIEIELYLKSLVFSLSLGFNL